MIPPLIRCALLVLLAGGVAAGQAPSGPAVGAPAGARAAGGGQGDAPGRGGRGQGPLTVPEGGFFFVQLSDTQFGFSNNDIDFIQDTANAEFAVATVNPALTSRYYAFGEMPYRIAPPASRGRGLGAPRGEGAGG
jgi:hypothetical protein